MTSNQLKYIDKLRETQILNRERAIDEFESVMVIGNKDKTAKEIGRGNPEKKSYAIEAKEA